MSNKRFSLQRLAKLQREHRRSLLLGLAIALLALFARLGFAVHAGNLNSFDEAVSSMVLGMRSPSLTAKAIDITSLGSATVLTLGSVGLAIFFLINRFWLSFIQLVVTMTAAPLGTYYLKRLVLRQRPTVEHLVEVEGLSFPSGHAMSSAAFYSLLAILALRLVPGFRSRVFLMGCALFTALLVALSRVYLGVHYPSDVFCGFLIGLSIPLIVFGLSPDRKVSDLAAE